ncbi:MAG: ATP-dependent DNA ligase [Candidatus Azotimanducaceae bacterium]
MDAIMVYAQQGHGRRAGPCTDYTFFVFEGLNEFRRHKSGIAVSFPRILRWRVDKPTNEADRLETVRSILGIDP